MKQRRQLFRRQIHSSRDDEETFYGIHAEAPRYNFLTNWTNILLPEATTGPFIYPQRQTMRQNIRDNQAGIPLSLEIGVIDVDTCEPLEGVLVDIWVSGLYEIYLTLVNPRKQTKTHFQISIAMLLVHIAHLPGSCLIYHSRINIEIYVAGKTWISTKVFPILRYVTSCQHDTSALLRVKPSGFRPTRKSGFGVCGPPINMASPCSLLSSLDFMYA
jgi:hypothetical protein